MVCLMRASIDPLAALALVWHIAFHHTAGMQFVQVSEQQLCTGRVGLSECSSQ